MSEKKTKLPSLPIISSAKDPKLDQWIRSVTELVQVSVGLRGKELDANPTFRDLVDIGLVIKGDRFPNAIGQSVGSGFTKPTATTTMTDLPPITGLAAYALYESVVLSWIKPSYAAYSHAKLYRATVNDYAKSAFIDSSAIQGRTWIDSSVSPSGVDYYYWIRPVSVDGIEGPINQAEGTKVTSSITAEYVIAELNGLITTTQLHADLIERINLIDTPITGLIDRLAQEIIDRAMDVNTEETLRIAAINNVTQATIDGDTAVTSNLTTQISAIGGKVWRQTTAPTSGVKDNDHWFDTDDGNHHYVRVGGAWVEAKDAGIAANAAAISTEQLTRANADTALSSSITALTATVATNTAAISTEATARANGDSANAASITTLTTKVNGHTASIQTLQTVQNGLTAEYLVKLDVNGYVSGFGLYNDGSNGTFIINADNFAVGKSGHANLYPFIIGSVNGVTKIGMNAETAIIDATITTAKIGLAQVTTLKVAGNAIIVPIFSASAFVTCITSNNYADWSSGGDPDIGAMTLLDTINLTVPAGVGTVTFVADANFTFTDADNLFTNSESGISNFLDQFYVDGSNHLKILIVMEIYYAGLLLSTLSEYKWQTPAINGARLIHKEAITNNSGSVRTATVKTYMRQGSGQTMQGQTKTLLQLVQR